MSTIQSSTMQSTINNIDIKILNVLSHLNITKLYNNNLVCNQKYGLRNVQ